MSSLLWKTDAKKVLFVRLFAGVNIQDRMRSSSGLLKKIQIRRAAFKVI